MLGKREGTHKGCPYRDCGRLGHVGTGVLGKREGTHKGCPYGGMGQVEAFEDGGAGQARGHPQGVPLRWDAAGWGMWGRGCWASARAPTRGAPTVGWGRLRHLRMAVLGKREGTHKGCPYGGMRRVEVGEDGGAGQARGQARGVPIRGVDGAGGTGFGWTPSIRHLL